VNLSLFSSFSLLGSFPHKVGVVVECSKILGLASVCCHCDFSFYQYLFVLCLTSRFFLPYFLHYLRFNFWHVFSCFLGTQYDTDNEPLMIYLSYQLSSSLTAPDSHPGYLVS
jgi:hypothetical protein